MSDFRIDQITNQAGTAGPQVAGITTFSSTSGLLMPLGPTEYRGGRGRGVFMGGRGPSPVYYNIIDYITISTTGDALDFGDLLSNTAYSSGCSNSTRGVFGGGFTPNINTIQYITISATGNAFNFGDLTASRGGLTSCSNVTRGIFGGGNPGVNIIDYIEIASLGNASDFGDLIFNTIRIGSVSSTVRGIFAGGYVTPTAVNNIQYVNFSTKGNTEDYGDLTGDRSELSGCSNSTRGVFGGGRVFSPADSPTTKIDYIETSSLGNSISFGDLITARAYPGAASNQQRAVWAGGNGLNVIEYVTISTLSNATDFGDLTVARSFVTGISDAHGGLGD